MRETPQLVINYYKIYMYVKKFIAWGQSAWYNFICLYHQRLYVKNPIKIVRFLFNKQLAVNRLKSTKLLIQIVKLVSTTKLLIQIVKLENKMTKNTLVENNENFYQWLVGMTDGDGTFSIIRENNKWNLTFKISLSRYNLRALYFIKSKLGYGSVTVYGKFAQFRIRDRKTLKNVIFPIFEKYPLLTSKAFHYIKFKEAYSILENKNTTLLEKEKLLCELRNSTLPTNYRSPIWNTISTPERVENTFDAKKVISKPWLVGFIEAEGSFYLVSKSRKRLVHAFGLSQKLDQIVLEGIRSILGIKTKVIYKKNYHYFLLNTTNSRAIENIINYFQNTMKGMKAVEYKIWANSYKKYKGDFKELNKIRKNSRLLKQIQPNLNLWD